MNSIAKFIHTFDASLANIIYRYRRDGKRTEKLNMALQSPSIVCCKKNKNKKKKTNLKLEKSHPATKHSHAPINKH